MANWEPAERVQKNDAGEYRAMIGGQWVPVSAAQKNDAGEFRVMRGSTAPTTQPEKAAPTFGQKVQASAPMRGVQGMRDPIDAGAQLLAHASPDWLTNALDYLPAKMRNSDSPLLQTIGESFFADPRAKAVDQRLAGTEQQLQDARAATGQTGFDVARLAGNFASPANAALARFYPGAKAMSTVPRMAATGAVAGGAGGLMQPVLDESGQQDFVSTKGQQGTVGALTGAVLTPILGKTMQAAAPYVNRIIDRMTGKGEIALARASLETDQIIAKALQDLGQRVDDIPQQQMAMLRQQVNEALRSGRKLDAAAQMRKSDFAAEGLPYTRGQITRDPLLFAREKNLRQVAGVGEPLLARLDEQAQGLQQRIGGLATGAKESQVAGSELAGALRGIDEGARRNVSSAYQAARANAGKDLDVPLQGLAQEVERIAKDYGKGNTAVQWARNYFKDTGIFGGTQRKVFSLEDAEQALQTINKNASNDPAVKNAFGEVAKAIKGAIHAADDQGGVFAAPRALAAERFKMQDAVKALGDVADGKAPVDRFVQKYIIGGESRDAQALAKLLREHSPEAVQQARAQLGAYIQRSAFGENMAGDKAVAPERLARVLRELGTERLSAFYSKAEIDGMKRLARISSYINSVPANAVPNTSGTAAALANLGQMIPGVSPALQIARAVGQPIANQRAVSAALSAKVPETVAPASPELIRRLQFGAAMGGMLGASGAVPR